MDTIDRVMIENLTNCLRSIRLNSGTVLHIPPRSTTQEISHIEVQDNTEIGKLLRKCSIAVHEIVVSTTEVKPSTDTEQGLNLSAGE